ncbi:MAG: hypothetical protein Q7R39_12240 [Dehalococcoidia bacterium]|nr:hypothetical protein [Dehalococcoidia bacterium]
MIGIAAVVLALVMAFGSVGPPRGQPAALAPTPTPTPPAKVAPSPLLTNPVIPPSLTVTPRPAPSVVVDLTFIPEGPPTPRPGPSPTPRPPLPPTGGPYISEKEALEKASIFTGRPGNQVSATVPPRAIFTTGGNINSVLGDALPASASQREVWIVVFEGRFTHLTAPPAPTGYRAVSAVFSKTFVVLDATTGEMTMAAVKDEIEPGRLEKQ